MTNLRKKLNLIRKKGGEKATLWWIYKKITHSEPFYVFMKEIKFTRPYSNDSSNITFLCLEYESDLASIDKNLLDQIHQQSGKNILNIIRDGGAVYSLVIKDKSICQLNINFS